MNLTKTLLVIDNTHFEIYKKFEQAGTNKLNTLFQQLNVENYAKQLSSGARFTEAVVKKYEEIQKKHFNLQYGLCGLFLIAAVALKIILGPTVVPVAVAFICLYQGNKLRNEQNKLISEFEAAAESMLFVYTMVTIWFNQSVDAKSTHIITRAKTQSKLEGVPLNKALEKAPAVAEAYDAKSSKTNSQSLQKFQWAKNIANSDPMPYLGEKMQEAERELRAAAENVCQPNESFKVRQPRNLDDSSRQPSAAGAATPSSRRRKSK